MKWLIVLYFLAVVGDPVGGSPYRWENSATNPDNSPTNIDNQPHSPDSTVIYNEDGEAAGYRVKDNYFNMDGERVGYE